MRMRNYVRKGITMGKTNRVLRNYVMLSRLYTCTCILNINVSYVYQSEECQGSNHSYAGRRGQNGSRKGPRKINRHQKCILKCYFLIIYTINIM